MPDGFIPQGSEFKVNTVTGSDQQTSSVTALADGGYVVTWDSSGQDGDGLGVFGQRYNASGGAVGSEFQVNSETINHQGIPSITALINGGFVVTWQSEGQDGDGLGVFGQRYDSSGVAVSSEFQVNTETTVGQEAPSITALADGGFVVTWVSLDQDGSGRGVYGQRYGADGVAVGGEFLVNTETTGSQRGASITALADGGFVVAWESENQDGDGFGIYAQRYGADGITVGGEFLVNTETAGNQQLAAITALADGGFIATWESEDQDGDDNGIFAQRYDATGAPVGNEFQVNTFTTGDQFSLSITALNDGGFVVTWTSEGQDGDGGGIYGQRYDSDSTAVGDEFQINSETSGEQADPSVTALANGGFVVTWTSDGQDGSGAGVYGQQFAPQTFGSSADEEMLGTAGNDWIGGQSGRDVIEGLDGNDILYGGEDDDILFGGAGNDELNGDDDEDTLNGGKGDDTLNGGEDDDILNGAKGEDVLNGGDNDDILNGGDGDDVLNGGNGYDFLNGDDGNDTLNGGARKDVLKGGKGDDTLDGGKDKDVLVGGKGADTLLGGSGKDTLKGGKGNDIIEGGAGDDDLFGGKGADIFVFSENDGSDTIFSFKDGVDKLDLSAFGFGSEAIAKSHFFEKGSASNNVVGFEFGGTEIRIEGIDLGDISGADLLLI